jgi:osmotically-inducible protein OsmY
MFGKLKWGLIGAAMAYLFDPVLGRGRRVRLKDQMFAEGRDVLRVAAKKARYEMGRAKGVVHDVVGSESYPTTDGALRQKIRSEVVGPMDESVRHIDIRVENGIVTLKGQSRDMVTESVLTDRIAAVTGVVDVRNELIAS